MGDEHVLHEHGLFLVDPELPRGGVHPFGAHDQMPQKLPRGRVGGGKAALRQLQLARLGDVVQDRAAQKQVAVERGIDLADGLRQARERHRVIQKAAALRDQERALRAEMENLQKATVSEKLSAELPENVRRALEIRQQLGKTSIKKYVAMDTAKGPDDRVRGLTQYYGANRTGRCCLTQLLRSRYPTMGCSR